MRSIAPSTEGLLHRSRLLELLAQRRDRKLILIHGKAGQGKSCLAADFLKTENLNALWHRCREEDRDPLELVKGLAAGLRQRTVEGASLQDELSAVLELLPRDEEEDLYFVVDDPHRICHGPEPASILQRLVEESSARTHWVLVSRGIPALSLARLRAQRSLFEIDDHELAFRVEEVAALFGEIYGLDLEAGTIKALAEKTEGWVTALVHVAEHLAPRDTEARLVEIDRFLTDMRLASLDEYFASEVIKELGEEDLRTLVQLSSFSSLSLGMVSHILGSPGVELLNERLAECYFLKCRDESLGIRAFHPLFSAFLRGRLETLEPESKQAVHARAAEYFRGRGQVDEAVHHLLASGDTAAAVELSLPRAEELLEANQLQSLQELLELFPVEVRRANSLLLYYEVITTHLAQPFDSRRTLRELLDAFEQQGDLPRMATIFSVLLVNYVFYQGNREPVQELVAMAERFLEGRGRELPEDRRATLLALVSLGRWWSAPDRGEPFEIALRAEETALALQNQELLVLAHLVLARIHLDRGEFDEAREILEETDDLLRRNPAYAHYEPLLRFHLGDTFFYLGELPKALDQVERGLDDAVPGFAFSTYLKLNRVLYQLYGRDIADADEVLEQVRDAPMGESLYLRYYSVYLLQMLLSYRKGHRGRAEYYCRRLMEPEQRNLLDSDFPYSTLALAENLFAFGDYSRAESLLRALMVQAPVERHPYANATAWALLGLIAQRNSQPRQAERCFAELRILLEKHGYRNLDICSPEVLQQVAEALQRADTVHRTGPLHRAESAFRRLQSEAAPRSGRDTGELRLFTLGEFRVLVRDAELSPTVLSRQKKVTDLLKLLVVHRKSGIVKEVLYDLFWPGYLQKSSRDNLNTIIYRLRKTLGENENFIHTDGTTLSLNRELCRVDADEFLEVATEAERTRQQGEAARAIDLHYRAKALYRGDFLEQDLYYDDIRDAREALRNRYLQLLFQLVLMSFDHGEPYQALVLAKELIYKDPLCEPAYRLLMIASTLVGTRSEVPRIFERLKQRLNKAYGIEADPQTESLAQSLLAGTLPAPQMWNRETLI